nr:MAG TPA: hypothetical protein [Caudoviricetes sp.]
MRGKIEKNKGQEVECSTPALPFYRCRLTAFRAAL